MTGIPGFNYEAFEKAATTLRNEKIRLLSPHEMFHGKPGAFTWEHYMKKNLTFLLKCDGLLQLRGWMKSPGATQEFTLAKVLSYPIWYFDKDCLTEIC